MSNVIGQAEPTFTMGEVLAEPKVLLVSLAKGLLGPEAASLIGSLLVAQREGRRSRELVSSGIRFK